MPSIFRTKKNESTALSQLESNVNESIELMIRQSLEFRDVQAADLNQVIDILFSIDTLQLGRLSVQLIKKKQIRVSEK